MLRSLVLPRTSTLNAKVAAIAMASSALAILVLTHFAEPLAPLRILSLAAAAFAAWAFCDEMGLRKPLNRAGFVFFCIAAASKVQVTLGVPESPQGRYHLLYAAFLLASVLLWSVAFLHRTSAPKAVGGIGAAASLATIIALIAGHLVVGFGAVVGVQAILDAATSGLQQDLTFVRLAERVFGVWCYLAAWLLWRGHIQNAQAGDRTSS